MRRAANGVIVLILAAVSLLVVTAQLDSIKAGLSMSVPPAPPPPVGACLDRTRITVPCSESHTWEVVASWAADDPGRQTGPATSTCDDMATAYVGRTRIGIIDGWTARPTVIAQALAAPAAESAGPPRGWTACGVQPAWHAERTGSIAQARSLSDVPDLFALCLDFMVSNGGTDCRQPHAAQILGSWNDASLTAAVSAGALSLEQLPDRLRDTALRSCLAFAAAMVTATDPTYGGQLDYGLALAPDDANRTALTCVATPRAGRALIGSITALGQRSLPVR